MLFYWNGGRERRTQMKNIITVSREFGSGGRELGKRLADELGFSYYDREIVTALAEKTGMDEQYLEQQLDSSGVISYPVHFAQTFSQITAVSESTVHLMSLQTSLIRELGARGNCVIVGRAADAVLEEYSPFRIFVCADQESKLRRCRQRAADGENLTDRDILRHMKRIDKNRAEYHDIISSGAWGDKSAYHLCINTTDTDIPAIVPAVAEYYRCWAKADGDA